MKPTCKDPDKLPCIKCGHLSANAARSPTRLCLVHQYLSSQKAKQIMARAGGGGNQQMTLAIVPQQVTKVHKSRRRRLAFRKAA